MSAGAPRLGRVLVALIGLAAAGVVGRTAWNLSRLQVPAAMQSPAPVSLPDRSPALPFDLPTIAGDRLSLAELHGRVVVVDFWATWCAPCRPLLHRLQALYEEMPRDRVAVVAIGVSGTPGEMAAYAEREGLTFPVLIGDPGVEAAYHVTALPALFVLDRLGRVCYQHLGYAPGAESVVRQRVQEVLEEPATLPAGAQ